MRCVDKSAEIKTIYARSDYMNSVAKYVAEKMNSNYEIDVKKDLILLVIYSCPGHNI